MMLDFQSGGLLDNESFLFYFFLMDTVKRRKTIKFTVNDGITIGALTSHGIFARSVYDLKDFLAKFTIMFSNY